MCACAFRQLSIHRVIILNGEIKGLQTSPVIQLSISWLISKQSRGIRQTQIYSTGAAAERDIPVCSGKHVNASITQEMKAFWILILINNFFNKTKALILTYSKQLSGSSSYWNSSTEAVLENSIHPLTVLFTNIDRLVNLLISVWKFN